MRVKLTAEQKKARKEKKRRLEIEKLIQSQHSIISFHKLFSYVGDEDGAIKEREISEARRKLIELESQL